MNELTIVKNDIGRKDNLTLIKNLMKMNMGIFQLPCLENRMYGPNCWGCIYEQFDNNFYRKSFRELLGPIAEEIDDYVRDDANFLGVIGVDGSPSCGIGLTYKLNELGGGISVIKDTAHCVDPVEMTDDKGIFTEELGNLFGSKSISPRYYDCDDNDVDKIIEKIE